MKNREALLESIEPKNCIGKYALRGAVLGFVLLHLIPRIRFFYDMTGGFPLDYIFRDLIYTFYSFKSLIRLILKMAVSASIAIGVYTIKEKSKAKKRMYISYIEKDRMLSLNAIAQSANVSYDTVMNDIEKMIKQGFFGEAHIDNNLQKVVLSDSSIDLNTKILEKSVKCPNCGATVTVCSHKENKCEYCGTTLNF